MSAEHMGEKFNSGAADLSGPQLQNELAREGSQLKESSRFGEKAVLLNRVSELEAELHAIRTQHSLLLTSTSWRMTRPIRGVKRLLSGEGLRSLIARFIGKEIAVPGDVGSAEPRSACWSTAREMETQGNDEVASARGRFLRIIAVGDATASTELCVQRPLDYMARHLGVEYKLYYADRLPKRSDLTSSDLLLLMRCHTTEVVSLARDASKAGIAIVYMTDDDMESLASDEIPELSGLSAEIGKNGGARNIGEIAKLSAVAMVFSEKLYQRFSDKTKTYLVPAISGPQFQAAGPSVLRAKIDQHEIRIGYAGSLTHSRDLAFLVPVLKALLDNPMIVIETIGQKVDELSEHPRYRSFPHVDGLENYFEFQRSRSWDIAIAPLEKTEFNEAKSDNKYRTYASAGIPAVYTRITPFLKSIRDGETGLLADNTQNDWLDKLQRLVADPDLRRRIAIAAREDVQRRFDLEEIAFIYRRRFAEALSGVKALVVGHLHLPTVHIDVRRPFDELSRRGKLRYRMRELNQVDDVDIEWADVMVIVRAGEPDAVEAMRRAQARGVKVIFTWDDDFFSITPDNLDLYNYYNDKGIISALESILSGADLVKCSTDTIADRSKKYNSNVMIGAYGFDFSLIPENLPRRSDKRIRIGYFGTLGRDAQFSHVAEALRKISETYPQVDLEFFGFIPKNTKLSERVIHLPFSDDYDLSIRMLSERQWDIGIAPLSENALNLAKLPTKYRDYGATNVAGIYSDVKCYRDVVTNGKTGILVDDSVSGWVDALDRLILSPETRKELRDAAYADVKRRFALDTALDNWAEAFRRIGIVLNPRSP